MEEDIYMKIKIAVARWGDVWRVIYLQVAVGWRMDGWAPHRWWVMER